MKGRGKAVGPEVLAQRQAQEREEVAQALAGELEAQLEKERRALPAGSDLAVTLELRQEVEDAVMVRAEDILGERGWLRVVVARRVAREGLRPALMAMATSQEGR